MMLSKNRDKLMPTDVIASEIYGITIAEGKEYTVDNKDNILMWYMRMKENQTEELQSMQAPYKDR